MVPALQNFNIFKEKNQTFFILLTKLFIMNKIYVFRERMSLYLCNSCFCLIFELKILYTVYKNNICVSKIRNNVRFIPKNFISALQTLP